MKLGKNRGHERTVRQLRYRIIETLSVFQNCILFGKKKMEVKTLESRDKFILIFN